MKNEKQTGSKLRKEGKRITSVEQGALNSNLQDEKYEIISQAYGRKRSLLTRIFLIFLFITLSSLIIFGVAVSSQQIALITDNTYLLTNSFASKVIDFISPLTDKDDLASILDSEKSANQTLSEFFIKLKKRSEKEFFNFPFDIVDIETFSIIFSTENKPITVIDPTKIKEQNVSEQTKKFTFFSKGERLQVPKEKRVFLLKALHLKSYKGTPFYSIPDLSSYSVDVYIPITDRGLHDYIFVTRRYFPEIESSLLSLLRLGIVTFSIVIFLQLVFLFNLHRILIKPIIKLVGGVSRVVEGDLQSRIPEHEVMDEVGLLIHTFNNMAHAIEDRTDKLESALLTLRKRNEIMDFELNMAQKIQQSLMPVKFPLEGIDFSVYYAALEKVSGDYYDTFLFSDGSVGVFIADASGHGVPAALITILAKVQTSSYVRIEKKPNKVLSYINKSLSIFITTTDYLTAFYLVLHPDLKMDYANASHQLTLIYRPSTNEIISLDTPGFFIAAIENPPIEYEMNSIQLEKGDKVLLYTDGLTEAANIHKEQYGLERLKDMMIRNGHLSCSEMSESIIKDFTNFVVPSESPFKDDTTLIIFGV